MAPLFAVIKTCVADFSLLRVSKAPARAMQVTCNSKGAQIILYSHQAGVHAHNISCHWLVQGNTIPYQYDPFWRSKWCPAHSSDGTLKCCACSRLQPRGEEWVTELDGRTVCLDCLSTLVRDTADAQPLYDQVGHMPGASLHTAGPWLMVKMTSCVAAASVSFFSPLCSESQAEGMSRVLLSGMRHCGYHHNYGNCHSSQHRSLRSPKASLLSSPLFQTGLLAQSLH